jgi:hypothetical protein
MGGGGFMPRKQFLVPATLLAVVAWTAPAAGQAACRPADATSASLIQTLQQTDADRTMRDSLHLALVAPSQIVLVTSSTICRKANQAYQSYVSGSGGSGLSGSVYVVQVGSANYAVLDPGYHYSDPRFWTVVVMDSRYTPLSSF